MSGSFPFLVQKFRVKSPYHHVYLVWLFAAFFGLGATGCYETSPKEHSNKIEEIDLGGETGDSSTSTNGHRGLVGSKACIECHTDIYDSYTKHPMWDSTELVVNDDDRPWKQRDSHLVPGTSRVLIAKKDDQGDVIHSEVMYDDLGNMIYEQRHVMDYVVGSGQRAKAYIRQEGERLYMPRLTGTIALMSGHLHLAIEWMMLGVSNAALQKIVSAVTQVFPIVFKLERIASLHHRFMSDRLVANVVMAKERIMSLTKVRRIYRIPQVILL